MTLNGTNSYVKLPAQLVNDATYQSVSMWFKANSGATGVLFSYNADPVTNGTSPANFTPSMYIGTSGKLHAQFWTGDGVTMVSPNPVNDGQWHHVALVGAGTTQSLYLDGAYVTSKSGLIQLLAPGGSNNVYVGAGFWGWGWPDEPYINVYPRRGQLPGRDGGGGVVLRPAVVGGGRVRDPHCRHDPGVVVDVGGPTVGRIASATVGYNSTTGSVSQVTDANGGVWQVGAPSVSGSYQVHSGAVLSADPADYWRLAENGTTEAVNQVHGGAATYNGVTLGVAGGPFDDPARSDDNTTMASFNGTSSY